MKYKIKVWGFTYGFGIVSGLLISSILSFIFMNNPFVRLAILWASIITILLIFIITKIKLKKKKR